MNTLAHRLTRFFSAGLFQIIVLTSVFMLTSIGCGSGSGTTTATTVPQPTQPVAPVAPVVPPVPAGWTNLDTKWFSFSYPNGWQLTDQTSANPQLAYVVEPGSQHLFLIEFQPGVINQPGILDQCAGARQALTDFYNANILPLEKNIGKYPNTTTTYDEDDYGFLSGIEYQITVVSTPPNSGPNFNLWLNAIPHADGLYLVGYRYPSEALDTWTTARKNFTDTIFFKSKALSSTTACNYKG